MSQENQDMVHSLLAKMDVAGGGGAPAAPPPVPAPGGRLVNREDMREKTMRELVSKKGFSQGLAQEAWDATEAQAEAELDHLHAFNEFKKRRLGRCLDYLILSVPDKELPPAFRGQVAEAAKKRRWRASGREAAAADEGEGGEDAGPRLVEEELREVTPERVGAKDESVIGALLVAGGFPGEVARAAARSKGGVMAMLGFACAELARLEGPGEGEAAAAAQETLGAEYGWGDGAVDRGVVGDACTEQKDLEIEALGSIFAEEAGLEVYPDYSGVVLPVVLPGLLREGGKRAGGGAGGGHSKVKGGGWMAGAEEQGPRAEASGTLTVVFEGRGLYPFVPPKSLSVDAPRLTLLNKAALDAAVTKQACELSRGGQPFLHELTGWIRDNSTQLLRDAKAALTDVVAAANDGADIFALDDEDDEAQDDADTPQETVASDQGQASQGEGRPKVVNVGPVAASSSRRTAAAVADPAADPDAEDSGIAEAEKHLMGLGFQEVDREEEIRLRREKRRVELERDRAELLSKHGEHDSKRLLENLQRWRSSGDKDVATMRAQRERLPAWKERQRVIRAIADSQVLVVAGETGCGKTTQVPQFILESWIDAGKGGEVSIVCTQPRRISATSVAARVAAERCETLGSTIGYQIRLESKTSRATKCTFCTTGVLLRRLVDDPGLVGVTHVIVDEVHERSLDSDFLLVLLRELLHKRPDLRCVLMSATLDAGKFQKYFGKGTRALEIPGFTFPVKEQYLEDVVQMLQYRPSPGSDWCRKTGKPDPAEQQAYQKLASQGYGKDTIDAINLLEQSVLNYELMLAVLKNIVKSPRPGAVLVFLPGLMEISKLYDLCRADGGVRSATDNGQWLIPLHSTLSTAQQNTIFNRPPKGVRKIVIATNIAETSITIDDVVFVVDAGRAKENGYNPDNHMCMLLEGWVSRASARQRRGRAGRVSEGVCYRLFTRYVHDHVFVEYQLPEIKRVPLEGLCLQIKLLGPTLIEGGVDGFLSRAIEPPSHEAIASAIKALRSIDALDPHERLTPLGQHLANLPVDARLGKMILYAAVLRCLDPCLTVAAALSSRSPFVSPLDKREEADAAKRSFAGDQSDHLAVVDAFDAWEDVRRQGKGAERQFCQDNFLSMKALQGIADLRQQFRQLLLDAGFLTGRNKANGSGGGGRGGRGYAVGEVLELANVNSSSRKLVKAVLTAGMYPNVARIEVPPARRGGPPAPPRLICRSVISGADEMVQIHPSSVNFEVQGFKTSHLVYNEKVQTSGVFLRDCTTITPYALLLFGGQITVQHGAGTVRVDHHQFKCPPRTAVLFKTIRGQLDRLLLAKMENSDFDIWKAGGQVVSAVLQLLNTEKPAPPTEAQFVPRARGGRRGRGGRR
ncbi:unnamed protein product [Pedinophyceae sp. YPF-701]|nr:unnamed protein product [Pedinophyceae sp. YPF-701]